MLRRRWRCGFLHAVPAGRRGPQLFGSLRSPASWLVAGSTPAPGGPESCWLPLCSQHSARLGLQPGKKTARGAVFLKNKLPSPMATIGDTNAACGWDQAYTKGFRLGPAPYAL